MKNEMIIANEKVTKDLLMAKTIEERNSILKQLYIEKMGDKVGDDLFHHHLIQLEIVTSHLDTISHAPLKVATIKNVQLLALIGFSVEMIDGMLVQEVVPKYAVIAPVWPTIKSLLISISNYKGDPEPLYKRMRLVHRAAKILLEVWGRSVESKTESSMYYAVTEEEFAKSLPHPISASIPISDQITALVENIKISLVGA